MIKSPGHSDRGFLLLSLNLRQLSLRAKHVFIAQKGSSASGEFFCENEDS
jgi:hypothetical protein